VSEPEKSSVLLYSRNLLPSSSKLIQPLVFIFLQHIAEIPYENQLIMRTKEIDHGTVTYLEKIDFLRSNLLAAHSVWLNEPEVSKHFHNRTLPFALHTLIVL
jgi:cytosine/adenosine deaminase-related metal-dependent hydrolase